MEPHCKCTSSPNLLLKWTSKEDGWNHWGSEQGHRCTQFLQEAGDVSKRTHADDEEEEGV